MIARRHFRSSVNAALNSNDSEVISVVLGVVLAARYLRKSTCYTPGILIRCDNVRAVAHAEDPNDTPEMHTLVLLLHNLVRAHEVNYPDVKLVFQKTPIGQAIFGHQLAHNEARRAARDPEDVTDEHIPRVLRRMLPLPPNVMPPPSLPPQGLQERLRALFAEARKRVLWPVGVILAGLVYFACVPGS